MGGKARSIDYNHNHQYEIPLPGEHGFRFFPGFYKHITDTMKRIPFDKNGKRQSVYNNLTSTSRIMVARYGKAPIVTPASFPKTLADIQLIIKDLHGVDSGLTSEEVHFFAERVWQLMTSSKTRRENDYERLGWWEYLQADRFSIDYQHLLVEGLTRTLVAAKAEIASTKTGGDIFLQLFYCSTDPSINTDRVLNGPTNEKWLYAWRDYLISKNVKIRQGVSATKINLKDDKTIASATITDENGNSFDVNGDYYIMAMPVERAAQLISDDLIKADKTLEFIPQLSTSVNWMNGLQYYLSEDIEINKGHVICSDTEWALTCISQVQFWEDYDIRTKGNQNIKGVLSVDISDWFTNGTYTTKKPAHECTREEVEKEVRAQLKASLNFEKEILRDDIIIDYYLDRDIREKPTSELNSTELENIEPLLVNSVNTWSLRPTADCDIPNLFFASDYVRTNTDLATMEGANEAARRAVNCILDKSESKAEQCEIWELEEPYCFDLMKWYDKQRYKKGLPWTKNVPFWIKALTVIMGVFYFVGAILKAFVSGKGELDPGSKKEKIFIISTMLITLGVAIFDAYYDLKYQSAFWLAIIMFAVISLFAYANKDKFLQKLIVFGLVAGFVELIADNWLVNGISSLVYPAEEAHIWASPNYMPFAWAVILVQVGYVSWLFTKKLSDLKVFIIAFLIGAFFIPIFETCAKYAEWWYYNPYKTMLFNTPLYIIIGEGLIAGVLPFLYNNLLKKNFITIVLLGILQGLWIFVAYYLSYIIL
jgi:uncharacterized protein with NAD-binding domain and iron-sulfur cluster